MASTPQTCPHCGSSSVVQDDLYSEAQLVCQDCGSVVAELQQLVTDTYTASGTAGSLQSGHHTGVPDWARFPAQSGNPGHGQHMDVQLSCHLVSISISLDMQTYTMNLFVTLIK